MGSAELRSRNAVPAECVLQDIGEWLQSSSFSFQIYGVGNHLERLKYAWLAISITIILNNTCKKELSKSRDVSVLMSQMDLRKLPTPIRRQHRGA